ncbi:hypothetical protein ECE50_015945 [Chitinophaga sp. Mgbs1]|uniref:Uncharacterized protein n=1 Tax=Chitinophaga solisilvae TaxID=1233460 RepID=A0A3S1JK79_9BACT|nr:hypothetical protein [Chitinophaga solisilvae]
MSIEITETELISLYNKAKENFSACIHAEENEFLKEEAGGSLASVTVKESDINIVLSPGIPEKYTLEICLILYSSDKIIGKYIFYEDDKGNSIDDSLILY